MNVINAMNCISSNLETEKNENSGRHCQLVEEGVDPDPALTTDTSTIDNTDPISDPTKELQIILEEEEFQFDNLDNEYVHPARPKIIKGTPSICVIGLRWSSNNPNEERRYKVHCETRSGCLSMGNSIQEFYHKNSRNLLNFKVSGFVVKVPYAAANKNQTKAEKLALKAYPGYDYYVIMSALNALVGKKPSNAGKMGGIPVAHLRGDNVRTGCHEVGHLLGLGHAGSYTTEKGQEVLDKYGDNQSVMSAYPSSLLTAPQYFHLGWLPKEEVALYQESTVLSTQAQIFTLKKVSQFTRTSGLTGVLIRRSGKRDAWVSRPAECPNKKQSTCVNLHLSTPDGGSQRVKVFGKEYVDKTFTGLKINVIEVDSNGDIVVSIQNIN